MPEIQYKFKSSLSFEIIKFSEPSITVGILKDLINQKQSIKTCGFDLKLKDSQGKVYTDDEDVIDLKSKIIVSRVPKMAKTQLNTKKKESLVTNNNVEITNDISDEVVNVIENQVNILNENTEIESGNADSAVIEKHDQIVPDILKCCFCNNLMKDSMQIKCCKTNYCHECITGYLFDPDISGSLECPNCKSVVSSKDVNLIDNMRIRGMVYNFQQGKFDSDTIMELENDIHLDNDFSLQIENVHEIEIGLPASNESCPEDDQIVIQSCDIETTQPYDVLSPNDKGSDKYTDCFVSQNKPSQIESIIHNNVLSTEIKSCLPELVVEKNQNIRFNDINQIEQHYQGHSYINQVTVDQQYTNRVEIPVINTSSHIPEIKMNSNTKDSSNLSIHDLDFDPVLYMKFLKIVGENCPEELRKILSNNNDSLHLSKDTRKSSNSGKRMKESDYHDKHVSKKSRYEMENDDSKYKKAYNPADKHSDNNRYYENPEKRSSRARSRSKEHFQKKPDTYPSSRRSRDYEARNREYYASNGARYRNTENQNYQDERHKYRPNYNSLNRLKSTTKYKRPMDR